MITIKVDDREALYDPITALSELLARPNPASDNVMASRKYIRLTGWIEDEDRDEARTTLWEKFVRDFDLVVQQVTDKWGDPDFTAFMTNRDILMNLSGLLTSRTGCVVIALRISFVTTRITKLHLSFI